MEKIELKNKHPNKWFSLTEAKYLYVCFASDEIPCRTEAK